MHPRFCCISSPTSSSICASTSTSPSATPSTSTPHSVSYSPSTPTSSSAGMNLIPFTAATPTRIQAGVSMSRIGGLNEPDCGSQWRCPGNSDWRLWYVLYGGQTGVNLATMSQLRYHNCARLHHH